MVEDMFVALDARLRAQGEQTLGDRIKFSGVGKRAVA